MHSIRVDLSALDGARRWAAGMLFTAAVAGPVTAAQTDIVGPPGSGAFGTAVAVLPNGHLVITDPEFDAGALADVGAVYVYTEQAVLVSTLTGDAAGDRVGCGGIVLLPGGDVLVASPAWSQQGSQPGAGAVTWIDGDSGLSGVVSASNSLVGSTAGDAVGALPPTVLANGNYVVASPQWANGASSAAGAATWGDGTLGVRGAVSAANSLIGSSASDQVGSTVVALRNGNYVVASPGWSNGATSAVGAVTWGSGNSGVVGAVSAANSLIGASASDRIGSARVIALDNGNYVVGSPLWDDGALSDVGAVT